MFVQVQFLAETQMTPQLDCGFRSSDNINLKHDFVSYLDLFCGQYATSTSETISVQKEVDFCQNQK